MHASVIQRNNWSVNIAITVYTMPVSHDASKTAPTPERSPASKNDATCTTCANERINCLTQFYVNKRCLMCIVTIWPKTGIQANLWQFSSRFFFLLLQERGNEERSCKLGVDYHILLQKWCLSRTCEREREREREGERWEMRAGGREGGRKRDTCTLLIWTSARLRTVFISLRQNHDKSLVLFVSL